MAGFSVSVRKGYYALCSNSPTCNLSGMSKSRPTEISGAIGSLAALIFIVFGICWMAFYLGESQGRHEGEAAFKTYDVAINTEIEQRICRRQGQDVEKCLRDTRSSARQANHDENDLAVQQRIADLTRASVVISFLATAASTIGLIALIATVRQGRENVQAASRANAIAAKQSELDIRPILILSQIIADGDRHPLGVNAHFIFVNAGNGPAKLESVRSVVDKTTRADGALNSVDWKAEIIDEKSFISPGDHVEILGFATNKTNFQHTIHEVKLSVSYKHVLSDSNIPSYVTECYARLEPHRIDGPILPGPTGNASQGAKGEWDADLSACMIVEVRPIMVNGAVRMT